MKLWEKYIKVWGKNYSFFEFDIYKDNILDTIKKQTIDYAIFSFVHTREDFFKKQNAYKTCMDYLVDEQLDAILINQPFKKISKVHLEYINRII